MSLLTVGQCLLGLRDAATDSDREREGDMDNTSVDKSSTHGDALESIGTPVNFPSDSEDSLVGGRLNGGSESEDLHESSERDDCCEEHSDKASKCESQEDGAKTVEAETCVCVVDLAIGDAVNDKKAGQEHADVRSGAGVTVQPPTADDDGNDADIDRQLTDTAEPELHTGEVEETDAQEETANELAARDDSSTNKEASVDAVTTIEIQDAASDSALDRPWETISAGAVEDHRAQIDSDDQEPKAAVDSEAIAKRSGDGVVRRIDLATPDREACRVPVAGSFYGHDDRMTYSDCSGQRPSYRGRLSMADRHKRWLHDRFNALHRCRGPHHRGFRPVSFKDAKENIEPQVCGNVMVTLEGNDLSGNGITENHGATSKHPQSHYLQVDQIQMQKCARRISDNSAPRGYKWQVKTCDSKDVNRAKQRGANKRSRGRGLRRGTEGRSIIPDHPSDLQAHQITQKESDGFGKDSSNSNMKNSGLDACSVPGMNDMAWNSTQCEKPKCETPDTDSEIDVDAGWDIVPIVIRKKAQKGRADLTMNDEDLDKGWDICPVGSKLDKVASGKNKLGKKSHKEVTKVVGDGWTAEGHSKGDHCNRRKQNGGSGMRGRKGRRNGCLLGDNFVPEDLANSVEWENIAGETNKQWSKGGGKHHGSDRNRNETLGDDWNAVYVKQGDTRGNGNRSHSKNDRKFAGRKDRYLKEAQKPDYYKKPDNPKGNHGPNSGARKLNEVVNVDDGWDIPVQCAKPQYNRYPKRDAQKPGNRNQLRDNQGCPKNQWDGGDVRQPFRRNRKGSWEEGGHGPCRTGPREPRHGPNKYGPNKPSQGRRTGMDRGHYYPRDYYGRGYYHGAGYGWTRYWHANGFDAVRSVSGGILDVEDFEDITNEPVGRDSKGSFGSDGSGIVDWPPFLELPKYEDFRSPMDRIYNWIPRPSGFESDPEPEPKPEPRPKPQFKKPYNPADYLFPLKEFCC